jgi:acyl-CoA synthetase (AMP-forming)/AMP-acid ligase II
METQHSPATFRCTGTTKRSAGKHWLAAYGSAIPAEIDPEAHASVTDMLVDAMQRFADKPAFRCFGRTLTYADTDRLSRNFAAYLQNRLGVRKGDRVAVMLPNIPAFPLAMLGIVRAGAVQVNVNPLYTPRELEHQLNDAGVETDARRDHQQDRGQARHCDVARRRHRRQTSWSGS